MTNIANAMQMLEHLSSADRIAQLLCKSERYVEISLGKHKVLHYFD